MCEGAVLGVRVYVQLDAEAESGGWWCSAVSIIMWLLFLCTWVLCLNQAHTVLLEVKRQRWIPRVKGYRWL